MKYLLSILLFISPVVWGNELKDFEFKSNNEVWMEDLKNSYSQNDCNTYVNKLGITEQTSLTLEATCDSGFFPEKSPEMSFSYKYVTVQKNDFGMVMNYQSFTFGLTFDTKTYQNGSESFVIRKPKINASYKGMFHIGKYPIHHKVTARWINPKKLMKFDDKIFPSRPLMDSRSEISSRVIYIGWHWKY